MYGSDPVTQPVDPDDTLVLPDDEDPSNPTLNVGPGPFPLSGRNVVPDAPVKKLAPVEGESREERLERAVRNVGAYWGRAIVAAWFTVFPRGTVRDIRTLWFRKEPTR